MKICSVCRLCYEDSIDFCEVADHLSLTTVREGSRLQVEGYRIDSKIESGLPVEIYKATHPSSKKEVLIRFIKADESCPDLQKDLKAVAKMNHPNLARVFEFGKTDENEFFVVLEEIEGQNLGEFLEKISPLIERDAIQITRQIAEGLEELHSAGVVHCAVNPWNIYFKSSDNYNFEVKLQNFDFGGIVQKQVSEGANGVDAKTNIFRFYSPEQFTDSKVDFKSDLYSLAVVFYEMLLGRSPYETLSPKAISEFVFKESVVEELHHDLRALLGYSLRESLQHRADLRPQNTNKLVRQLRHLESVATPAELALIDDESHLPTQKNTNEHISDVDLKIDDFESQPKVKAVAASQIANEPFELNLPDIATVPEKANQSQVADQKFEIIEYNKPSIQKGEEKDLGLIDDLDFAETEMFLEKIGNAEADENSNGKRRVRALDTRKKLGLYGQNYFSSIIKNSFYVAGLIALIFFGGFITARFFEGKSVVSSSPNNVPVETEDQNKTDQTQEDLSLNDLMDIHDETKTNLKTENPQTLKIPATERKETTGKKATFKKGERKSIISAKAKNITKIRNSGKKTKKQKQQSIKAEKTKQGTKTSTGKSSEKKTRPRFVPNEKIIIDPSKIQKNN